MINKLTYIESTGVNPYKNLAMEEYLFSYCGEDEAILYLWQNQHTIVIGRNQNAWKECQISRIEEDGAVIARRLSGGGAVFHDLGNLNFTFLVSKENYDLKKQLDVILKAVQKLAFMQRHPEEMIFWWMARSSPAMHFTSTEDAGIITVH